MEGNTNSVEVLNIVVYLVTCHNTRIYTGRVCEAASLSKLPIRLPIANKSLYFVPLLVSLEGCVCAL